MLYIWIDNMDSLISEGRIKDKKLNTVSVSNIITEVLDDKYIGQVVEISYKEFAVIVNIESHSEADTLICRLAKEIADTIKLYMNFTVSIVISYSFSKMQLLNETFKVCKNAMNIKFYTGNGSIVNVKDAVLNKNLAKYDYSKFISNVKRDLELGNAAGTISLFENIFDKAENEKYNVIELKKMFSMVIYDLNALLINWGCANTSNLDKYVLKIESSETLNEYKNGFFELLKKLVEMIQDLKIHTYGRDVKRVIDYINEHMSDKITLKMIAKEINMNESYLCRTFKNSTGKNFVDFVYKLKIEKAKELLKNTDIMVKEVSAMIGIDDQFYFNRIFKKYVGVSPSEYKNMLFNK